MRIATIQWNDRETASLCLSRGLMPVPLLNQRLDTDWSSNMMEILTEGQLDEMVLWYNDVNLGENIPGELEDCLIPEELIEFAPLYRNPGKIWGIGLNYREHARDLSAPMPGRFPASFMKPASAVIGPGDFIRIPLLSKRTTAEAELGIIMGKKVRNLKPARAMEAVAGFTCIIDVTAEDILQLNPRYLTLSKSFDSFFSFGPCLITPDEISAPDQLRVATVVNGKVKSENVVSRMMFSPEELISFHSRVMTLMPGDVISTGTPGAAVISEGDEVTCRIDGFPCLTNRVFDLKKGR
ncbi:MAG: fumarylacetoacetate hydrolase family protein [Bacteroidales bacterium]